MDEPGVERETVVVNSGSRGGGGGIVAILAILVLAILAFLYFGGYLGGRSHRNDVNVNVNLPKIDLPPVHIDNPAPTQQQQPSGNQTGR